MNSSDYCGGDQGATSGIRGLEAVHFFRGEWYILFKIGPHKIKDLQLISRLRGWWGRRDFLVGCIFQIQNTMSTKFL